jgi:hypothetical protein
MKKPTGSKAKANKIHVWNGAKKITTLESKIQKEKILKHKDLTIGTFSGTHNCDGDCTLHYRGSKCSYVYCTWEP